MQQKIGLLGASSQADEIEAYLGTSTTVAFRAVSPEYFDSSMPGHLSLAEVGDHKHTAIIAAVGAPAVRKSLIEAWPGNKYHTVIAPNSYVAGSSTIGSGSVVSPGAVVTTNVIIGQHAIVNVGATVSHDCVIGNYVTIGPGAHIAGNVELGAGVFVGIGASVSNDVKVANGVVIGAGAVVTKSISQENVVVVGVPAVIIKKNDGWLNAI